MKLASLLSFAFRLPRNAIAVAGAAIMLCLALPAGAQTNTLTITPNAASKVYGNLDPAFTFTAAGYAGSDTAADVFTGDVLTRTPGSDAGEYAFRIGALTTRGMTDYNVVLADTPPVFTITEKEVTYTTTAANKIYDGTPAAPEDFGGAFDDGDILAGDDVRPSGGVYLLFTAPGVAVLPGDVGTGITIGSVGFAGNQGGNYTFSTSSSFTGSITAREAVYISGSANKIWDNTTLPPNVLGSASLANAAGIDTNQYAEYGGGFEAGSVVTSDIPELCLLGGAFARSTTGSGILLTGFSLGSRIGATFDHDSNPATNDIKACDTTGAGMHTNYTLSTNSVITGDITRRNVSPTNIPNFISKVYDTTAAGAGADLPGGFGGDSVPAAHGGVDPADYISWKAGDFNSAHVNASKLPDDKLTCLRDPATGIVPDTCDEDDDKPAFKISYSLTAGSVGDHSEFYNVTAGSVETEPESPAVAAAWTAIASLDEAADMAAEDVCCHVNITPAPLTLSNVRLTKVYDGTKSIAGAEITADTVTLRGESFSLRVKDGAVGEFASNNVGTGITITGLDGSDLELVSNDIASYVSDYIVSGTNITATGDITKRPLCIIASGEGATDPTSTVLGDGSLLSIFTDAAGDACPAQFAGHTIASFDITGALMQAAKAGGVSALVGSALGLADMAPGNNYELAYQGGQWLFTTAADNVLVVTPTSGLSRVYGDAAPAFPFSIAPQAGSNFAGSDAALGPESFFTSSPIVVNNPSGDTGHLDVGVHPFSLAVAPAYATGIDAKYDFVINQTARHTVTKRPLHITPDTRQNRFFLNKFSLAQAQTGNYPYVVAEGDSIGYAPSESATEALTGKLSFREEPRLPNGYFQITLGTLAATDNYFIASYTGTGFGIFSEKPNTPTIDSVDAIVQDGAPVLRVQWSIEAGAIAVESWRVENREKDTTAWIPQTVRGGLATVITTSGGSPLKTNQAYEVRVSGISFFGTLGDASDVEEAAGIPLPPAPVLSATTTNSISADKAATTVSWTHSGSGESAAVVYELQVVTRVESLLNDPVSLLSAGVDLVQNADASGGTLRGLDAATAHDMRLRVIAQNGLRSAWSADRKFISAGFPSDPGNLSAVTGRSRELRFSWNEPGAGPSGARVVGYDVRWRTARIAATSTPAGEWQGNVAAAGQPVEIGNSAEGVAVPGGAREYSVTGLTSKVGYDLSVRARNQLGAGDWSGFTQATAVSSAPDDATLATLTLTDAEGNAVMLSPAFNANTLEYTAEISQTTASVTLRASTAQVDAVAGSEAEGHGFLNIDAGGRVFTVSTDPFLIRVNSRTLTTALLYEVTLTRQLDPPSEPRNVAVTPGARAGELNVAWDTSAAGDPTAYTVRWKLASEAAYADADKKLVETDDDGNLASATVLTGLTNAAYDVQVSASNSGGPSAYTTAMQQATPPAVSTDSSLTTLTLNAAGAAVVLTPSFTAGTTAYSASVHNRVDEVTLAVDSEHVGASVSVTDGTTPQNLGDSGESTPFALTVGVNTLTATVTAEDASTTDYVLTITRQDLPPDAPAKPTLISKNVSLDVAWITPTNNNGSDITGYLVRWAETGTTNYLNTGGAAGLSISGIDTISYTITGLTNGTAYDVQVAAVSARGESDFSEVATAAPAVPDPTLDTLVVTGSDNAEITLSQTGFAPATEDYTISVTSVVSSVTLTATATDSNATIALTRDSDAAQTLTSGTASGAQALDYAGNVLTLVVTAVDGTTTKTYTLTFSRSTGAPPAPPVLTLLAGIEKMTANWQQPVDTGGVDITHYLLRWAKAAAAPVWINTNGKDGQNVGNVVTLEIPNLEFGVAYIVGIAAVNSIGATDFSASVTATPAAAGDDADIHDLDVLDSGGATVTLTPTFSRTVTAYTATIPSGRAGVSFTARYPGTSLVVGGDSGNSPGNQVASGGVNLALGQEKAITLVVTAVDGNSQTYTVTVTRAAAAPGAPDAPTVATSSVEPGGITVTWVWDNTTRNNGSVQTGFNVQWRVKDDTTWLPDDDGQNITDAAARTYAATGLTAGDAYEARVRAVNSAGGGAWSAHAEGRASGAPDAPTGVALDAKAGRLEVAWTPPVFTGGAAINAYFVRWRESPSGNWMPGNTGEQAGSDGTARTHTIDNLTGGTAYDVEVLARNAFASGNIGAWSGTQTGTPTRPTLFITPEAATKVYGVDDPAVGYAATGFVDGDTVDTVFSAPPFERAAGEMAAEYGYTLKAPLPFNTGFAGKYTPSLTAGDNKFVITVKTVTYTSTSADKVYDGNVTPPADLGGDFASGDVVNTTVNGVAIDDTVAGRLLVSDGAFGTKAAGENKAVTGFTLSGDSSGNYTLADASSVTGTIAPRPTTVTWTVDERVYDGTTDVGTVGTLIAPSFLSGDIGTSEVGAKYATADAGDAKEILEVMVTGTEQSNYDITLVKTGVVTKRPLRVTAGGSGSQAPTAAELGDRSLLTIGSETANEGLVGGELAADVLSGSIALGTRAPASGEGKAPLTVGSLAASANYELDFTDGEFLFSAKKTLVITSTTTTRVYGGTEPSAFAYAVTVQDGSAFETGDTAGSDFFSGDPVRRMAGDDAGSYPFSLVDPLPLNTGFDAKYNFVIAPGTNYVITPKELTAAKITLTKDYDGTNAITGAAISGGALTGLVGDEMFTLAISGNSDGAYSGVDVGSTLTKVSGADFELQAVAGNAGKTANYTLADTLTGGADGGITALALRVGNVTLTKEYDGGTTLASSTVKAGTGVVAGTIAGEGFRLSPTAGAYATADVATGLSVPGAAFDYIGDNAASKTANYTLPALTVDGEITAVEVTVGAVTVTKTYDAGVSMTGAVISGAAVSGVVSGESFTLGLASDNNGVYDSADVSANVGITGPDFVLVGADADSKPGNYMLPGLGLTGVIAKKAISVSDLTLHKEYDGTDAAAKGTVTILFGYEVTGVVGTQTFTMAVASDSSMAYATTDAADAILLTTLDAADFEFVPGGGANPTNYALPDFASASPATPGVTNVLGSIVPREVSVTDVTLTKTYDGTEAVEKVTLKDGVVGGTVGTESLTLQSTEGRGRYSSADAGTGTVENAAFTLQPGSDTNADNYKLPASITVVGVIEALEAAVTVPKLAKEYDGTTGFPVTELVADSGVVSGLISPDALVLVPLTGLYADKRVGTREISGITWELQTAEGGEGNPDNYALPDSITVDAATLSDGEIRRKNLMVTFGVGAAAPTKVYDGTSAPPPGLTAMLTVVGLVAADTLGVDVAFGSSTYNSKNVLEANALTVDISGPSAPNYTLSAGGVTATITPKSVGVTVTASGPVAKAYDGTTAAPVGFSFSGSFTEGDVIEADRGKVALGTTGVYDSKGVGASKTIRVSFTGEEAGNYISDGSEVNTASITARLLRIAAETFSDLEQPPADELVYTIGVRNGEGLVTGESASDVLSGMLAYGTQDGDGNFPILQGTLAATANYNLIFTDGLLISSSMLDVDISGKADSVDGILISRYLFGLRGTALTANLALKSGENAASVEPRIAKLHANGTLDVDGNAGTTVYDGIIIARYLLGVTSGPGLVAGQAAAENAVDAAKSLAELLPSE